jgi:hypothetical protein
MIVVHFLSHSHTSKADGPHLARLLLITFKAEDRRWIENYLFLFIYLL